jgi:hypothetical protein
VSTLTSEYKKMSNNIGLETMLPALSAQAEPRQRQLFNDKNLRAERARRQSDVLKGAAPLGVAGGLIGLAAFVEPGVILGTVFLGAELMLGGLSLYKLWPKK